MRISDFIACFVELIENPIFLAFVCTVFVVQVGVGIKLITIGFKKLKEKE